MQRASRQRWRRRTSRPCCWRRRIRCTPRRSRPPRRPASTCSARSRWRLSRKDAEASVAACKAAGVFLGIGHERRYEPAMTELRKIVKSGAARHDHARGSLLQSRQARQRAARRLAHLAEGRAGRRHDRDGHPSVGRVHRPVRPGVGGLRDDGRARRLQGQRRRGLRAAAPRRAARRATSTRSSSRTTASPISSTARTAGPT